MPDAKLAAWWHANQRELTHAVRTTVAAVVSLLIARLFRLPESYWAAITTIVVLQSTLGAAWAISKQRFAGTALGAFIGALLASHVPGNVAAFGIGILAAGVICALLHIERNAYRYAGITVAIVVLIQHAASAWIVGLHRFIEISVGIAIGLAVTAVWPESPVRVSAPAAE
jgi:uncharacterized membrane protein YccC